MTVSQVPQFSLSRPHLPLHLQVFDNTPAALDGTVAAGDEITGVNGRSIKGKTKVEVAKMIQEVKVRAAAVGPGGASSASEPSVQTVGGAAAPLLGMIVSGPHSGLPQFLPPFFSKYSCVQGLVLVPGLVKEQQDLKVPVRCHS